MHIPIPTFRNRPPLRTLRPTPAIIALLLILLLLQVLITGCTWHLHSDANQKTAQKIHTNFQTFTSQSAGATATYLTNLTAEDTLARATGAKKLALDNMEFA